MYNSTQPKTPVLNGTITDFEINRVISNWIKTYLMWVGKSISNRSAPRWYTLYDIFLLMPSVTYIVPGAYIIMPIGFICFVSAYVICYVWYMYMIITSVIYLWVLYRWTKHSTHILMMNINLFSSVVCEWDTFLWAMMRPFHPINGQ
jgi:hypothetical protein